MKWSRDSASYITWPLDLMAHMQAFNLVAQDYFLRRQSISSSSSIYRGDHLLISLFPEDAFLIHQTPTIFPQVLKPCTLSPDDSTNCQSILSLSLFISFLVWPSLSNRALSGISFLSTIFFSPKSNCSPKDIKGNLDISWKKFVKRKGKKRKQSLRILLICWPRFALLRLWRRILVNFFFMFMIKLGV